MAGFIQDILWNSVEGFVDAAKKTGGEYAGNALIKAGDLIEGGGRSVGGGLEKAATGYGSKLSGQTYQASSASKALPSTARKPVVKRSNSMPANTKPSGSVAGGRSIAGPTSGVPLGAKKTVGGARKAVGGVASGAVKTVGGGVSGATRGINSVAASTRTMTNAPKPSSSTTASTPAYPSAKKTAVKPNASKPFTSSDARPDARKPTSAPLDAKKPYPGTSTLPGQGGKTPVKRSYKPAPTLGSQVKPGQKMVHIGAF
ncbi:hypothetical protein EJ07DRAFT_126836 [Lizonia empirigonia]|nr:hypothetical protein EJ07DRAFT_126836 [Lizonia empirigonia]